MYCLWQSPAATLYIFASTMWLAQYLPSMVPLLMSFHAFLLPGMWGKLSVVDYWSCKTDFLAVGQLMCIYLPWLQPRATAFYEGIISFSWLCTSCCHEMLADICFKFPALRPGKMKVNIPSQELWLSGGGRGEVWFTDYDHKVRHASTHCWEPTVLNHTGSTKWPCVL